MRERFRGWYSLEEEERDGLWNNGLIVVDTNVLLDLYRLSPSSRTSLFASLSSVSSRLWLPYQVGLEFHKTREQARANAATSHTKLSEQVKSDAAKLIRLVGELRAYNPSIDSDESLRGSLKDAADQLATAVKSAADEYKEPGDPVLDQLEVLYPENRIGRPFEEEELKEARAEAESRIAAKIPPGFEDSGKSGDSKYGDYFLWRQTLAVAKDRQTGVIFVTRDEKKDWRQNKEPLPELLDEFVRETGVLLEIVHPQTFIRETSERKFWEPEDETGVEQVTEEYERAEARDLRDALAKRASGRWVQGMQKAFQIYYQNNPDTLSKLNGITIDPELNRRIANLLGPITWSNTALNNEVLSGSTEDVEDEAGDEPAGEDDDAEGTDN